MVEIVSEKHIKEFAVNHAQHAESLYAWISIVKNCSWEKPIDILGDFNSTDILPKKDNNSKSPERAVFDVKGNNIRIIIKYQFFPRLKKCKLYLKWIGTHAEYTKLCKKKLQYEIDLFN
jgi:mRNA interferase HigB